MQTVSRCCSSKGSRIYHFKWWSYLSWTSTAKAKDLVSRDMCLCPTKGQGVLLHGQTQVRMLWILAHSRDTSPEDRMLPPLDSLPKADTVPLEPGFLGARYHHCHLNCSRSPSLRSCLSHWCSLTRHCWNVLMPLVVEATGVHCKATKRSNQTLCKVDLCPF